VTDPEGFRELEVLDPVARPFLNDLARRRAYPFAKGRPLDSNIVTLLTWAEHLSAIPTTGNRFLAARAAGRKVLNSVERARPRTVVLKPFKAVRLFCIASYLLACVAAVGVLITSQHLVARFDWWIMALLIVAPTLAALGAWVVLVEGPNDRSRVELSNDAANPVYSKIPGKTFPGMPIWIFSQLPFSVALLPALYLGVVKYLMISFSAVIVCCYLPATPAFERGRKYYVWRPNKYVDMYDDPASCLWVIPDSSSTLDTSMVPAR
jgi:hypothetical protein